MRVSVLTCASNQPLQSKQRGSVKAIRNPLSSENSNAIFDSAQPTNDLPWKPRSFQHFKREQVRAVSTSHEFIYKVGNISIGGIRSIQSTSRDAWISRTGHLLLVYAGQCEIVPGCIKWLARQLTTVSHPTDFAIRMTQLDTRLCLRPINPDFSGKLSCTYHIPFQSRLCLLCLRTRC